jgi:hypothetical protein
MDEARRIARNIAWALSLSPPRAFDSRDLETIQWVYEAAWAQIALRDPARDPMHDAELQAFLRKRVFAFASIDDCELRYIPFVVSASASSSEK